MKILLAFVILIAEMSTLLVGSPANSQVDLLQSRLPITQFDNNGNLYSLGGSSRVKIYVSGGGSAPFYGSSFTTHGTGITYLDLSSISGLQGALAIDCPITPFTFTSLVGQGASGSSQNQAAGAYLYIYDTAVSGVPNITFIQGGVGATSPNEQEGGSATEIIGCSSSSITIPLQQIQGPNDFNQEGGTPTFSLAGTSALTSVTFSNDVYLNSMQYESNATINLQVSGAAITSINFPGGLQFNDDNGGGATYEISIVLDGNWNQAETDALFSLIRTAYENGNGLGNGTIGFSPFINLYIGGATPSSAGLADATILSGYNWSVSHN